VRVQIKSILAKLEVSSQLAAVALVRPQRISELVGDPPGDDEPRPGSGATAE
jgi:hypothetical protein